MNEVLVFESVTNHESEHLKVTWSIIWIYKSLGVRHITARHKLSYHGIPSNEEKPKKYKKYVNH